MDAVQEYDQLCEKICKASGMELTDMLSELDETSGAILGAAIQSSKRIIDLAMEQADIMDRQEKKIDEISHLNEKLLNKMELLLAK